MKSTMGWDKFIENCLQMKTVEDLHKFFELTLTVSEWEKIGARYLILAELISGNKTQREIAADLGVSIFNVTRGANQLKRIDEESKSLISIE